MTKLFWILVLALAAGVLLGYCTVHAVSIDGIYYGQGNSTVIEHLVFCPICQKEGLKSKVYPSTGMTCTLLHCGSGHYDEDGHFHSPGNCNHCTRTYECSNGHTWSVKE
jgi:hypothetical protein